MRRYQPLPLTQPKFEAAPYIAPDYDALWKEVERICTSLDPRDIAMVAAIEKLIAERIK